MRKFATAKITQLKATVAGMRRFKLKFNISAQHLRSSNLLYF